MELCEGGDLFELLRRRKRLSEAEAAGVGRSLLAAVAELQSRGLMHRDIKPENILLLSDPLAATSGSVRVKVVDFGLAAFVKPGGWAS